MLQLLVWLPVTEIIESSLEKMTYKSINTKTWPKYLNREKLKQTSHNVRSNNIEETINSKSTYTFNIYSFVHML